MSTNLIVKYLYRSEASSAYTPIDVPDGIYRVRSISYPNLYTPSRLLAGLNELRIIEQTGTNINNTFVADADSVDVTHILYAANTTDLETFVESIGNQLPPGLELGVFSRTQGYRITNTTNDKGFKFCFDNGSRNALYYYFWTGAPRYFSETSFRDRLPFQSGTNAVIRPMTALGATHSVEFSPAPGLGISNISLRLSDHDLMLPIEIPYLCYGLMSYTTSPVIRFNRDTPKNIELSVYIPGLDKSIELTSRDPGAVVVSLEKLD